MINGVKTPSGDLSTYHRLKPLVIDNGGLS
jgi:hypothetical protein